MDISTVNICERIARVLAGQRISANAGGSLASCAAEVDTPNGTSTWRTPPPSCAPCANPIRRWRRPARGGVEHMILTALEECEAEA